MLAMNYREPFRVRVDHKPYPELLHLSDAVVRVTRSCICGSDLHLYHGLVPDTRVGTTFGHEFIGVVEAMLSCRLTSPAANALSVSKANRSGTITQKGWPKRSLLEQLSQRLSSPFCQEKRE